MWGSPGRRLCGAPPRKREKPFFEKGPLPAPAKLLQAACRAGKRHKMGAGRRIASYDREEGGAAEGKSGDICG